MYTARDWSPDQTQFTATDPTGALKYFQLGQWGTGIGSGSGSFAPMTGAGMAVDPSQMDFSGLFQKYAGQTIGGLPSGANSPLYASDPGAAGGWEKYFTGYDQGGAANWDGGFAPSTRVNPTFRMSDTPFGTEKWASAPDETFMQALVQGGKGPISVLGPFLGLLAAGGIGAGAAGVEAGGGMGAGADIFGNFDMGYGLSGMEGFTGGAAGAGSQIAQVIQQLQQIPGGSQIAQALLGQMGGGGGGAPGAGGGLGSLLPLLGIGSGLSTMFGGNQAVDPNMINSLWQAGQNTYNTSLDPRGALHDRTQQQVVDASRAGQSARGLGMGPYGAGIENKAVSDFNIDWQNQQLQRQMQGTQAFTGAGNAAANAGVANNAQAFLQNQTGLNNLTTGLNGLFGGAATGAGAQNPIGAWLNSLFSGAKGGVQASPYESDTYPNPFGSNYDGLQTDAGYYGGSV